MSETRSNEPNPESEPIDPATQMIVEELGPVRDNWLLFLLLGVDLVIVGLIAIASPAIFSVTTAVLFGVLTLLGGVLAIVTAFVSWGWKSFLLELLLGTIYVILGVLMIRHPVITLQALTLVLGVFIVLGGVFRIAAAFSLRFPNWGWTVFSGVLGLILGGIILGGMPWSAVWVIGLFIGIEFLFSGVNWIMIALLGRAISIEGQKRDTPAATNG